MLLLIGWRGEPGVKDEPQHIVQGQATEGLLSEWLSIVLNCKSQRKRYLLRKRWRSGRASESISRGPGFDHHRRLRAVSLSKTYQLPTVLAKSRKSWLLPKMTKKLLTGTLSLNTNKQTKTHMQVFREQRLQLVYTTFVT